ncbi:hypothetical protein J6590_090176, partial [Homalodisca vitripennis]
VDAQHTSPLYVGAASVLLYHRTISVSVEQVQVQLAYSSKQGSLLGISLPPTMHCLYVQSATIRQFCVDIRNESVSFLAVEEVK